LRNQINALPKRTIFNREILAFNEATASQLVEEGQVYRLTARSRYQETQTIGPPRLLRHRSERTCDRAAYKRNKLAPPHGVSPVPRPDRAS
jgi:hypothetical protein